MRIIGTLLKHSKISSSFFCRAFGNSFNSWSPSSNYFIKSCIFNWFKKSMLHFKPWRNFLLSSWDVSLCETFTDSLYQIFGPNCTCPYLWDLAAWIDAKFALAVGSFFSFLNILSLSNNFLLRSESDDTSPELLSLSLTSISTLPLTPAFWTSVLRRFVQLPFVEVGTGKVDFIARLLLFTFLALFLALCFVLGTGLLDDFDLARRRRFDIRETGFALLGFRLDRLFGFLTLPPELSHNSHMSHICETVAPGIILRMSEGVPFSMADNWHRFSDIIPWPKIFVILEWDT